MVWLNVIAISIQSTTVGAATATMHDGTMSDVEVLNGPRVTLRPPTLDDAELLFERIASDPEVSRHMSWRPHPNVDETRRVITDVFNVGGETTWLIELREGGGPIGVCGWRRPQPHIIDFGYCLGHPWWRQGLMSEVLQLLLDKAQRDPTVYRMTAHCHVDNTASAALLKRSGLALEGRLVRYAMLPNISAEPQDCLLFGKALR
jgi:[ribosomal protein S5]-alanine N-acetyltransferase